LERCKKIINANINKAWVHASACAFTRGLFPSLYHHFQFTFQFVVIRINTVDFGVVLVAWRRREGY
jgi:hypothetical protein